MVSSSKFETPGNTSGIEGKDAKTIWSQLENGTLFGQATRSFTALLLCCFLGALLLLRGLRSLLCSLSRSSSRILGLRFGTVM